MATAINGVLNDSDIVSDHDFDIMVRACGRQLERDVAPLWGRLPWKVKAYASESRLPRSCTPIRMVDDPQDADDEGAFGWHFEKGDGRPYGRVFVNSVLAGLSSPAARAKRIRSHDRAVSVILSHEVIEAFLDPDINLWAFDPKDGFFHAIEAYDPVQSQAYGRLRPPKFAGFL